MKLSSALPLLAVIAFFPSFAFAEDKPSDEGFKPIFDGQSLKGWHVSAKNGVKIMEWTETEARLPVKGHIGLIHGGGKPADYEGKFVRYRNIRVKRLGAEAAE